MEDLDHADDLALLSYTHLHIQGKTQRLNTFVKKVGLNISSKRTEIMIILSTDPQSRLIMKNVLTQTDFHISALGSIIGRDGGADLDIQSRLRNSARNSLNMMNKVWRSSTNSTRTKLKLYYSCVLTTLPCMVQNVGAWRRRNYHTCPRFIPGAFGIS